ncbi:uncharacterized protein LOC126817889 [Patella vulgata]|uniref:uncharacterized protein LOC126817889 n=1 Tax=Patella vulgata TaxID=6465 RepID=UPI00217F54D0|nr:uncharacterized protein LOC126817889 [Patella vulgata]
MHCDNCTGQNKNKFVLSYLAWRVIHGLHKSITLNFLITGHTKFSPDWCFGLIKQKFRKSRVCSVAELADVVQQSTVTDVNLAQPTMDGEENIVQQYNWHQKFNETYKAVIGIKKYHFRFCHKNPGVVFCKEYRDSDEVEVCLLKDVNVVPTADLPLIIPPPGLTAARQWYLFEKICEFCSDETQDATCPRPTVEKPCHINEHPDEITDRTCLGPTALLPHHINENQNHDEMIDCELIR